MKTVSSIKRNDCCGCSACYSICKHKAIIMQKDKYGFLYPIIDESNCNSCGLCYIICPNNKQINNNQQHQIQTFACYNTNNEERRTSSSGGIFILLAQYVIENGGVVFGAEFNDDFSVSHNFGETKFDILKFQGSKYVQSDINETYFNVLSFLKTDRLVLFSGTPCQISGLKSFLRKDYKNLICVDFICHGVPSPMVWQKHLLSIKKYCGSINSIEFRNKETGWSNYKLIYTGKDSMMSLKYTDDNYFKGFLNNLYLRPSCYQCHFKTINRDSDFTLGDFWGIDHILPKINDDKGMSLLIIQTELGENIYQILKKNIQSFNVNIHDALKFNASAIVSSKPHYAYSLFKILILFLPFNIASYIATNRYFRKVLKIFKINNRL